MNAKADPVGLCNLVLGRLAVEKVLDDGTVLAVDNLTSAEVKKIWEINRGLHILDGWEPSGLRNLTLTQVQTAVNNISDLSSAKAVIMKLAEVVLWLLKREMNEV